MLSIIEPTTGLFKCLLRFYGHKRSKIFRNTQRRAGGKASTFFQFPDSVDEQKDFFVVVKPTEGVAMCRNNISNIK